jgi:mannose/cellobiose epimerase-like protein (N-acyl-D-glucosamine 2-epimerase family)
MHAVEAALSAASVTGNNDWIERARSICRFVTKTAEAHDWRIPEHFDANWEPLLDLNRDQPGHPFKPFGATVGHGLEWARLFLNAEAAGTPGDGGWLVRAAEQLFERAVTARTTP